MSHRLYTAALIAPSVDMKNTGSSSLGFTENGARRFIPLLIHIHALSAANILTVATVSVGTNGASYNNILGGTLMTGLTAANRLLSFTALVANIETIAPNTEVFCNVGIAVTGLGAALMSSVRLIGYYE